MRERTRQVVTPTSRRRREAENGSGHGLPAEAADTRPASARARGRARERRRLHDPSTLLALGVRGTWWIAPGGHRRRFKGLSHKRNVASGRPASAMSPCASATQRTKEGRPTGAHARVYIPRLPCAKVSLYKQHRSTDSDLQAPQATCSCARAPAGPTDPRLELAASKRTPAGRRLPRLTARRGSGVCVGAVRR